MPKGRNKNKQKSYISVPPALEEIEMIETSSTGTDEQEWSGDIEILLGRIFDNCSLMSKYHKHRYLALKGKLIYFRIPLIVLGGANSVFAVGLTAYMEQQSVSLINCLISLICAIITSTELFLGIQSGMERELTSQRDFYLMAVDINSVLTLDRRHRTVNGKRYLEKMLSAYNKLIGDSEVIQNKIEDKLISIVVQSNNPTSEKLSEINLPPTPTKNLEV